MEWDQGSSPLVNTPGDLLLVLQGFADLPDGRAQESLVALLLQCLHQLEECGGSLTPVGAIEDQAGSAGEVEGAQSTSAACQWAVCARLILRLCEGQPGTLKALIDAAHQELVMQPQLAATLMSAVCQTLPSNATTGPERAPYHHLGRHVRQGDGRPQEHEEEEDVGQLLAVHGCDAVRLARVGVSARVGDLLLAAVAYDSAQGAQAPVLASLRALIGVVPSDIVLGSMLQAAAAVVPEVTVMLQSAAQQLLALEAVHLASQPVASGRGAGRHPHSTQPTGALSHSHIRHTVAAPEQLAGSVEDHTQPGPGFVAPVGATPLMGVDPAPPDTLTPAGTGTAVQHQGAVQPGSGTCRTVCRGMVTPISTAIGALGSSRRTGVRWADENQGGDDQGQGAHGQGPSGQPAGPGQAPAVTKTPQKAAFPPTATPQQPGTAQQTRPRSALRGGARQGTGTTAAGSNLQTGFTQQPVNRLSAAAVGGRGALTVGGRGLDGRADAHSDTEEDEEEEQLVTALAIQVATSPGVRLLAVLATCCGYGQCTQVVHHLLECVGKPDSFPGASAPHWAALALLFRSASLHHLRASLSSAMQVQDTQRTLASSLPSAMQLQGTQQDLGRGPATQGQLQLEQQQVQGSDGGQARQPCLQQLLSSLDGMTKDRAQPVSDAVATQATASAGGGTAVQGGAARYTYGSAGSGVGGYGVVEAGESESAAVVDALSSAKVSYFLQAAPDSSAVRFLRIASPLISHTEEGLQLILETAVAAAEQGAAAYKKLGKDMSQQIRRRPKRRVGPSVAAAQPALTLPPVPGAAPAQQQPAQLQQGKQLGVPAVRRGNTQAPLQDQLQQQQLASGLVTPAGVLQQPGATTPANARLTSLAATPATVRSPTFSNRSSATMPCPPSACDSLFSWGDHQHGQPHHTSAWPGHHTTAHNTMQWPGGSRGAGSVQLHGQGADHMGQGGTPKEDVLAEEAESAESAWRIAAEAAVMVFEGMGLRGLSRDASNSLHTLMTAILSEGPAWAVRAVLQAAGMEPPTPATQEGIPTLTVPAALQQSRLPELLPVTLADLVQDVDEYDRGLETDGNTPADHPACRPLPSTVQVTQNVLLAQLKSALVPGGSTDLAPAAQPQSPPGPSGALSPPDAPALSVTDWAKASLVYGLSRARDKPEDFASHVAALVRGLISMLQSSTCSQQGLGPVPTGNQQPQQQQLSGHTGCGAAAGCQALVVGGGASSVLAARGRATFEAVAAALAGVLLACLHTPSSANADQGVPNPAAGQPSSVGGAQQKAVGQLHQQQEAALLTGMHLVSMLLDMLLAGSKTFPQPQTINSSNLVAAGVSLASDSIPAQVIRAAVSLAASEAHTACTGCEMCGALRDCTAQEDTSCALLLVRAHAYLREQLQALHTPPAVAKGTTTFKPSDNSTLAACPHSNDTAPTAGQLGNPDATAQGASQPQKVSAAGQAGSQQQDASTSQAGTGTASGQRAKAAGSGFYVIRNLPAPAVSDAQAAAAAAGQSGSTQGPRQQGRNPGSTTEAHHAASGQNVAVQGPRFSQALAPAVAALTNPLVSSLKDKSGCTLSLPPPSPWDVSACQSATLLALLVQQLSAGAADSAKQHEELLGLLAYCLAQVREQYSAPVLAALQQGPHAAAAAQLQQIMVSTAVAVYRHTSQGFMHLPQVAQHPPGRRQQHGQPTQALGVSNALNGDVNGATAAGTQPGTEPAARYAAAPHSAPAGPSPSSAKRTHRRAVPGGSGTPAALTDPTSSVPASPAADAPDTATEVVNIVLHPPDEGPLPATEAGVSSPRSSQRGHRAQAVHGARGSAAAGVQPALQPSSGGGPSSLLPQPHPLAHLLCSIVPTVLKQAAPTATQTGGQLTGVGGSHEGGDLQDPMGSLVLMGAAMESALHALAANMGNAQGASPHPDAHMGLPSAQAQGTAPQAQPEDCSSWIDTLCPKEARSTAAQAALKFLEPSYARPAWQFIGRLAAAHPELGAALCLLTDVKAALEGLAAMASTNPAAVPVASGVGTALNKAATTAATEGGKASATAAAAGTGTSSRGRERTAKKNWWEAGSTTPAAAAATQPLASRPAPAHQKQPAGPSQSQHHTHQPPSTQLAGLRALPPAVTQLACKLLPAALTLAASLAEQGCRNAEASPEAGTEVVGRPTQQAAAGSVADPKRRVVTRFTLGGLCSCLARYLLTGPLPAPLLLGVTSPVVQPLLRIACSSTLPGTGDALPPPSAAPTQLNLTPLQQIQTQKRQQGHSQPADVGHTVGHTGSHNLGHTEAADHTRDVPAEPSPAPPQVQPQGGMVAACQATVATEDRCVWAARLLTQIMHGQTMAAATEARRSHNRKVLGAGAGPSTQARSAAGRLTGKDTAERNGAGTSAMTALLCPPLLLRSMPWEDGARGAGPSTAEGANVGDAVRGRSRVTWAQRRGAVSSQAAASATGRLLGCLWRGLRSQFHVVRQLRKEREEQMEAQASGGLAAGPTDADRSAAGAQAPPPSQQHPGAADSAPDASAAASSKTKKKKKHGSKAPTASSDAGAKPAAAATVSISRLLAGDMDAVGRHPGLLHPEVVILTLAATVNGALFLASAAHQQHKQGPENQVASTAGRTLWAHVVSALYYTLNVCSEAADELVALLRSEEKGPSGSQQQQTSADLANLHLGRACTCVVIGMAAATAAELQIASLTSAPQGQVQQAGGLSGASQEGGTSAAGTSAAAGRQAEGHVGQQQGAGVPRWLVRRVTQAVTRFSHTRDQLLSLLAAPATTDQAAEAATDAAAQGTDDLQQSLAERLRQILPAAAHRASFTLTDLGVTTQAAHGNLFSILADASLQSPDAGVSGAAPRAGKQLSKQKQPGSSKGKASGKGHAQGKSKQHGSLLHSIAECDWEGEVEDEDHTEDGHTGPSHRGSGWRSDLQHHGHTFSPTGTLGSPRGGRGGHTHGPHPVDILGDPVDLLAGFLWSDEDDSELEGDSEDDEQEPGQQHLRQVAQQQQQPQHQPKTQEQGQGKKAGQSSKGKASVAHPNKDLAPGMAPADGGDPAAPPLQHKGAGKLATRAPADSGPSSQAGKAAASSKRKRKEGSSAKDVEASDDQPVQGHQAGGSKSSKQPLKAMAPSGQRVSASGAADVHGGAAAAAAAAATLQPPSVEPAPLGAAQLKLGHKRSKKSIHSRPPAAPSYLGVEVKQEDEGEQEAPGIAVHGRLVMPQAALQSAQQAGQQQQQHTVKQQKGKQTAQAAGEQSQLRLTSSTAAPAAAPPPPAAGTSSGLPPTGAQGSLLPPPPPVFTAIRTRCVPLEPPSKKQRHQQQQQQQQQQQKREQGQQRLAEAGHNQGKAGISKGSSKAKDVPGKPPLTPPAAAAGVEGCTVGHYDGSDMLGSRPVRARKPTAKAAASGGQVGTQRLSTSKAGRSKAAVSAGGAMAATNGAGTGRGSNKSHASINDSAYTGSGRGSEAAEKGMGAAHGGMPAGLPQSNDMPVSAARAKAVTTKSARNCLGSSAAQPKQSKQKERKQEVGAVHMAPPSRNAFISACLSEPGGRGPSRKRGRKAGGGKAGGGSKAPAKKRQKLEHGDAREGGSSGSGGAGAAALGKHGGSSGSHKRGAGASGSAGHTGGQMCDDDEGKSDVDEEYEESEGESESWSGSEDEEEDGGWSDLEDFIVCQPGRDYHALLAARFRYNPDRS